jgi:hypothetical protein
MLVWGVQSAFSQSKKEQIEVLIFQKDSLMKVLVKERNVSANKLDGLGKIITQSRSDFASVQAELTQTKKELIEKKQEILRRQSDYVLRGDTIRNLRAELFQAKVPKNENMLPDSFTGYWMDSPENCGGQLGLGIFVGDDHVDISGYHSSSKDVQVKYNGEYYSIYYTNVYEEPDFVDVSKAELHIKMAKDGKLIILNLKTREETKLVKC